MGHLGEEGVEVIVWGVAVSGSASDGFVVGAMAKELIFEFGGVSE